MVELEKTPETTPRGSSDELKAREDIYEAFKV